MSTLWHPDVCGCQYTADSKTFAFESQIKSCDEHKTLAPIDAFNAALDECRTKSHTVVEAQKLYPEIRDPTASPSEVSDYTLDAKKAAFAFDASRKFVLSLAITAPKKTDIQTTVDAKIGAGKAIIQ